MQDDVECERDSKLRANAVRDALAERRRQEALWGRQDHDPFVYVTILTEEVGEVAEAAHDTFFGGKAGGVEAIRKEAVQVAAVALAMVESLDRGLWRWPPRRTDPVPGAGQDQDKEGK